MNWHEGHINKYARVLLENPKNGCICGYTDNYIKMVFHDYEKEMANRFVRVRIDEAKPEYCSGEILEVIE